MKHVAAFSSNTEEWSTPRAFVDALAAEFGPFTLDPCATDENKVAGRWFTKADNGLIRSWEGETVFMNPPYSHTIGRWIRKAYEESEKGALVVALIPVRSCTKWWHLYVMKAAEIRLIRGRMRFGGSTINAPFPSCVVIWDPRRAQEGTVFIGMDRVLDERNHR